MTNTIDLASRADMPLRTELDGSELLPALAGDAPIAISVAVLAEAVAPPAPEAPDWADITDKPETFPPAAHSHAMAEVTGLADALDAKASEASVTAALADKADAEAMTLALAGKASLNSPAMTGTPTAPTADPGTDTDQIATTAFVMTAIDSIPGGAVDWVDIENVPEEFPPSAHGHAISDVSGLAAALHTKADADSLGSLAAKNSINNGDWSGTDLAIANGGTGASTAAAARTNLGLGNIDNTSDAEKPVSAAQQTALNSKVSKAGDIMTGALVALGFTARGSAGHGKEFISLPWGATSSAQRAEFFGTALSDAPVRASLAAIDEPNNESAWFHFSANGSANIPGALSKGSGTFLIDHPLDPSNRDLRHGFVEAPEYQNRYRGTVRLVAGAATVDIDAACGLSPGTFAAINTDVLIQGLQNLDGFAGLKPSGPLVGGVFGIVCEDSGSTDLVAWEVTARRNDPFVRSALDPYTDSEGRLILEADKPEA